MVAGLVGLVLIIFPQIDLAVSRLFFRPDATDPSVTFVLASVPWAQSAHDLVMHGSQALGVALTLAFFYCAIRLCRFGGLGTVQWLFLALALAAGPGVVANVIFKEHWGRARPAQIQDFGGSKQFTPPMVLSNQCSRNCSFVSGDPSAGFYLHTFAYVARRRQRTIFYGGIAIGLLIGVLRIAQGAHFFSDVLFSGAFMIATSAAIHALFYGVGATTAWWRCHVLPQKKEHELCPWTPTAP